MLTTNKQRIQQVYECVKTFHGLEELPHGLPDPQHVNLLPTLRPYQNKAVQWMLSKELYPSYYMRSSGCTSTSETAVLLPKGGILADEMGLGKTVEMLACILSNPRPVNGTNFDAQVKTEGEMLKETENLGEDIKLDTTQFILSGDEFNPTEDGIVEIQNEDVKPNVNIQYGLDNVNDSGCVMDFNSSEAVVSYDEEKQAENTVSKRKRTEKVIDDTDAVPPKKKKRTVKDEVNKSAIVTTDEPIPRRTAALSVIDDTDVVPPRKKRRTLKDEVNKSAMLTKDEPRSRRTAALPGQTYSMLKNWYEDCLSETKTRQERKKRLQRMSTFQCCCFDDVVSDNIVQCPECQTWQHAECVGYDETSADFEYCCFQCWQHKPLVQSAGTVIISPESISQQWVSEIEKHVKKDNLKLLVYEGVRVTGYIQPHDLANYDVIITTYQVLTKELNYTKPVQRNLRHAKRYFAPTSPLLFVQWWRLCLDEAQMVEGSTCRAAEMSKKFTAVNKWAVTGTPIQKAVNDMVGLMEFLAGEEYPDFLALMSKDWLSLLLLVPRVLWRTQKKDVLAETGVPPQTEETHLLDFSKIELYFYMCTHTECSQQFLGKISRFNDLSVSLKSIDRRVLNSLLNPLLKMRQACLHPQAVRGKFMSVKKTMTMEDLVSQMVTNAKLDAEQALRQLVASLNGIGALRIIREEWLQAAEAYRGVLHLEQEYNPRLKIDSLQKIHAMHNLAEVLDGDYEGIPPTLRDGTLRDDMKALELRYLGKRESPITSTEERVDQHTGAIAAKLEGATLSYSNWWEKLLQWSNSLEDELLDKLKAAIQLTDTQQKNQYNNLANKLKSLYIVHVEVAQWLAELDKTREEVRAWLRELRCADKDDMASDALNCHLPQANHRRGRTRCKLCQAESVLKHYESLLFEARNKDRRKSKKRNLPGSVDWKDDKDMENKEIAELVDVNVNTFESSKKGGFKASPIEKIMRALVAYGRQKQAPSNWTKEGNDHLSLIQRVKKEFLDLNLLWRQIFDLVDARDELNMCKTRLRTPFHWEDEEQETKKKKIGENLHIIPLYRVEPELRKLEEEKLQHEALLKKKTGTLCYLETLQKDGGAQVPICPICRCDLTDKWSVLECGHCLCLECLSLVCKPTRSYLMCPQCRQHSDMPSVSYVENQPSQGQPGEVKGSHSSKVHAVVAQTLRLVAEQPDVKILVFSQWEKVLDLLAEAFEENSITFRRLKSGKLRQRENMKDFKRGNITVLLLPLRSGAKGLNLVEATHVFLVEPILNPAEELQAVGRVHRIGQTKPTVVHRFIVRDTIEERILAAVAESGADQWSDDCVTLRQLYELFTPNADRDQSLSQIPGPSAVTHYSDEGDHDSDSDSDRDDDQPIEFLDTASDSDDAF